MRCMNCTAQCLYLSYSLFYEVYHTELEYAHIENAPNPSWVLPVEFNTNYATSMTAEWLSTY